VTFEKIINQIIINMKIVTNFYAIKENVLSIQYR